MVPERPPATRRFRLLATMAILCFGPALTAPVLAQTPREARKSFTAEQAREIEQVVRAYLLEHPEVIFEAVQIHQQRQQLAAEQRRREAIAAHAAELRGAPGDPVLGAPDGDVVLVEFFDYRCPYCRGVATMVRETVAQDGNVRLVMKELPILGPPSVQAARAALAAHRQDPGKYGAFHAALMTAEGDMSDGQILQIARDVGLDAERLAQGMQDPEIDAIIDRSHALAEALGVSGTPAFVIGETLVPGATDQASLERLIAQERAKASR